MEKFETVENSLQWKSLKQLKNLGKLHCSATENFETAEKFG